nr:hypothetical protein [Candidatus Sigynarchaeota archaeon]
MEFKAEEMSQIKARYPDLLDPEGKILIDSPAAKKLLESWQLPKAFDKIGYARPLGGFFYQFFYGILGIALQTALFSVYLGILYPFPESGGYAGMAGILFAFLQTIFNVPTEWGIDRFAAEWRVKNPRKMMAFLNFYIWWQMLTGLVLISGVSFFIFFILNDASKLMYTQWLMLIIIIREYPAFGGIFINTIRGLQAYNKEATYNFISSYVTSKIIEIVFVLWGQYGIGSHINIGAIIGIAIGAGIGSIVSDLVNEFIGMFFLRSVLKPMGFRLIDVFRPRFDKDVAKVALKFGFIVSIPGLFGSFFGTITTLWWYFGVPAFLTFSRLSGVADSFANLMKAGGGINIRGTLSEAYNSGKKNLTSYYIAMQWKFFCMFAFALGSLIIAFMPFILTALFHVGSAANYALAAAFVVPNIIATTAEEPIKTAENVILAANKPHVDTVLWITGDFFGLLLLYLALFVFKIPLWGTLAIIWLIPLLPVAPNLYRGIASWVYIGKKLCPVEWKRFAWQTFIAPIPPAIIYGIIGNLWVVYIFPALTNAFGGEDLGIIIAAVITVLFAIFFGLFFFFPVYGLMGGWDKNSLAVFKEAVEISGPSKFIFMPILRMTLFLGTRSPLHDKFPIPFERAQQEAVELMQLRHIKDTIVKEIKGTV